jgi:hypothetical protein
MGTVKRVVEKYATHPSHIYIATNEINLTILAELKDKRSFKLLTDVQGSTLNTSFDRFTVYFQFICGSANVFA